VVLEDENKSYPFVILFSSFLSFQQENVRTFGLAVSLSHLRLSPMHSLFPKDVPLGLAILCGKVEKDSLGAVVLTVFYLRGGGSQPQILLSS
jgi:hypothetical protein